MTSIFELIARERKKGEGDAGSPRVQVAGAQQKAPRFGRGGYGSTRPRGAVSTRGTYVQAVVKSSFVQTGRDSSRHIGSHIEYISERNQKEWEKRRIFNRDRSDIDKDTVVEHMRKNQGRKVSMHKMILSPGDNNVNLVGYTRDSMHRLEQELGYTVDWYAVEHYNTDHYHAHVVIAGKIPEQSREERFPERQLPDHVTDWAKHMEGRDLRVQKNALDVLRDAGNRYLLRERSIDRALDQAIEREFGLDSWTYDRYIEKELGLTTWRLTEDKYARELAIPTSDHDRIVQGELALGTKDNDKAYREDLGLAKIYDLGIVFKEDPAAQYLRELSSAQQEEKDRQVEADPLASTLYGSRELAEEKERDEPGTNLSQLAFSYRSTEKDFQNDRGDGMLSDILYRDAMTDRSVPDHGASNIFHGLQSGNDKERNEDQTGGMK